MVHQHEDILKCLRNKSVSELTKFRFEDNPSFLTAMGPSRDGIIIPADFGINNTITYWLGKPICIHSVLFQRSVD